LAQVQTELEAAKARISELEADLAAKEVGVDIFLQKKQQTVDWGFNLRQDALVNMRSAEEADLAQIEKLEEDLHSAEERLSLFFLLRGVKILISYLQL
jgi:BMFP domain-containing protein YqiC